MSARDLTEAWDSNVKSPAHAGVRQLSAEQMEKFRRRYLDALAHARDHEPDALTRGDILYAIGRR